MRYLSEVYGQKFGRVFFFWGLKEISLVSVLSAFRMLLCSLRSRASDWVAAHSRCRHLGTRPARRNTATLRHAHVCPAASSSAAAAAAG